MSFEVKSERFQMLLDKSTVEAIDEWSFKNRIRTRAEAIRVLVRKGLCESETKKAEARA